MAAQALMPDGTPAPTVMTTDEVIRFLRMDTLPNPKRTLNYYREARKIKPVRMGKENRWRLEDVLEFLARQSEEAV